MMKAMIKKQLCLFVMGIALLTLLLGCAGKAPKKEEAGPGGPLGPAAVQPGGPEAQPASSSQAAQKQPLVEEKYYFHLVKWSGETVSIIAGWYTGDIQNWKILAEANPDIKADRITVGMKIKIPERAMTTKAPMTKEYVDGFYRKPKKQAEKTSIGQDEEPKLFGPK